MTTTLQLIHAALAEDIGPGDLTASHFTPADARCQAAIVAKVEGVIAGCQVAAATFTTHDPALEVDPVIPDGTAVQPGDTVLRIRGATRSVLSAERTALNFLGRLSGIATLTRKFVDAVEGTGARVLDTRKTTPGWRALEKAAVAAGGGTNHRHGLYDQVMVKDNHLLAEDAQDALRDSIAQVHARYPGTLIELEADTLDQVRRFLDLDGVGRVLLDNMTAADLREAVTLVRAAGSPFELEASGNVTLTSIREIAETGVDFISSGALTHSATSLDLSLTLE